MDKETQEEAPRKKRLERQTLFKISPIFFSFFLNFLYLSAFMYEFTEREVNTVSTMHKNKHNIIRATSK